VTCKSIIPSLTQVFVHMSSVIIVALMDGRTSRRNKENKRSTEYAVQTEPEASKVCKSRAISNLDLHSRDLSVSRASNTTCPTLVFDLVGGQHSYCNPGQKELLEMSLLSEAIYTPEVRLVTFGKMSIMPLTASSMCKGRI
jgi:hypothetical protein